MRTFRPTAKAAAIAGALAVTLVVAGTSGAVAGKLITSRDIKDGTIKPRDLRDNSVTNQKIAPGAVDWEKSLSAATKAQIESMAGEQGAPGEQGPPGPAGPAGSRGQAGDGALVSTDFYGLDGAEETGEEESYVMRLPGRNADSIEISTPGNYLVSLQGLFPTMGGPSGPTPGAIFLADTEFDSSEVEALMRSCMGLFLPVCNATVPLTVRPGEPADLSIYWASFGSSCNPESEECPETPAIAKVSIYRMGGALPAPDPDYMCELMPCEERAPLERQLRGIERELAKVS